MIGNEKSLRQRKRRERKERKKCEIKIEQTESDCRGENGEEL